MIISIPLILFIIVLGFFAALGKRQPYVYVVIHFLLRNCEGGIVICLLNVVAKSWKNKKVDSVHSSTKDHIDLSIEVTDTVRMNESK